MAILTEEGGCCPGVAGKQRQRHGEDQGFEHAVSSSKAEDSSLGSRLSCYYGFPDELARNCLKSATRPDPEVVGPNEGGEKRCDTYSLSSLY
jgi:hypothetical protein